MVSPIILQVALIEIVLTTTLTITVNAFLKLSIDYNINVQYECIISFPVLPNQLDSMRRGGGLDTRPPSVVVSGYSIFFFLFRSKKRTDRGNQRCLKKLKKIISCIFVFLTYRICLSVLKCGETKTQPCQILTNNNALDGFIYRLHRFCRARIT